MIARKVSPLSFAVLFAISGCSLAPEFVQLSFQGQVFDAATGNAIAGATVSLVDALDSSGSLLATGTTNAEGRYSLTYPDCADVPFITATADGYQPIGAAVGCSENSQNVNIELTPEPAP